MPSLTPGSQVTNLADRVAAWFGYERRRDDLAAVPFGPGTPIEPSPIAEDQRPRQFEYTVAANTNITPRGEYPKLTLTPFQQLRQLARFYSTARICINTRVDWVCSARWDIKARNPREQDALQSQCDALRTWFLKPDRVTPFPTWLRLLLVDQLEVDALCFFKQRDRAGRLLALQPIDGTTIKPLLDVRGVTAAYQQILYGYVRGQYDRSELEDDLPLYEVGGDLVYRPRWVATDSPYGSSPTEWIILLVNMAIRKQTFDLSHFTDGNVPAGFYAPPKDIQLNPEQVRQFEDAFNADLAGDDRARNRIKFMPWQGGYTAMTPFSYGRELDEWLAEITCGAFHIPPSELGVTRDVNRATGESQENVAYRHAIQPDTTWLKVIFDELIQVDLGQPALEWKWDFGETEDVAKVAGVQVNDVKAGIISANESRKLRYPYLEGEAPGAPAAPAGGAPAAAEEPTDTALALPAMTKADETVTTETGLTGNDLAQPTRRRRKRSGKRPPIDVERLIESEAAGALEWAKKARQG